MATSTTKSRKKPGPKPKGATYLHVAVPPEEMRAINEWIKRQPDKPSRPEALRRLAQRALANDSKPAQTRKSAKKAIKGRDIKLSSNKREPKRNERPAVPALVWDDHIRDDGICSGTGNAPGATYVVTPQMVESLSLEDFRGYAVYRVINADKREQLGADLKTYQEAKAIAEADYERQQS
jgi:hypothetical protein